MAENQQINDNVQFNSTGFRNVVNKFVQKARANVYVLLIVPKPCRGETLKESLENVARAGAEVYYVVDVTGALRHKIITDEDLRRFYTVYLQAFQPPKNLNDFFYRRWVAKLWLPLLVTTAARVTWRGITTNMLLNYAGNSLMATLVNTYWEEVFNFVTEDVMKIVENPNVWLLCDNCSRACPLHREPWHFNMKTFAEADEPGDPIPHGVFDKYKLFGNFWVQRGDDLLLSLRDLYNLIGQNPGTLQENAELILDQISVHVILQGEQQHCCYLLCILVGPGMAVQDQDGSDDRSIQQLLDDEQVYKLLYVGVTKGDDFRQNHLTDLRSPVRKALTKDAKMYVLRRFVSDSRLEAEKDEARIIELLKFINSTKRDNFEPLTFWLLNKNSSPQCLLGEDMGSVTFIQQFANSGRQVFSANTPAEEMTDDPTFVGEYGFGEPEQLDESAHDDRGDLDNATHMKNVKFSNENIIWSDYIK